MTMRGYRYKTRRGPVYIVPRNGRWSVIYDDDDLGSYHSPVSAADDVAGGHTLSPSNGADFEELGVPESIHEWEQFRI